MKHKLIVTPTLQELVHYSKVGFSEKHAIGTDSIEVDVTDVTTDVLEAERALNTSPTISALPQVAYEDGDLKAPLPIPVLEAIMANALINAIKLVRSTYTWPLKESKDYVEHYAKLIRR